MNIKFLFNTVFLASLTLAACNKNSGNNIVPTTPEPTPDPEQKMEIRISPTLSTRATDFGFETNDCIGLFVVNYNGTTPGTLQNSGNYVDNMRFTYSGIWTPDTPIFWKDNTTHADFYLYYPYTQTASVNAYPFTVKADQSTESAYKASDMLVGKAVNVAPTESAIIIAANHVMSRINIQLAAGSGFTKESLAKSNITVKINDIKTESTVNIASGEVTATGNPMVVTPFHTNDAYKAIIVPQTVNEGNLITVTADGREFNLTKSFTFEGGKNHNFTVTLSKTSNGINVNINPWNEDGSDNGGVAE